MIVSIFTEKNKTHAAITDSTGLTLSDLSNSRTIKQALSSEDYIAFT